MTGENSLLASARQVLGGLKKTADGAVLHGLIERGLRKFNDTHIEGAFLAFTDRLLERYLASPDSDPATRIKVKVIQQRLRLYLDELGGVPASTPAVAAPASRPVATRAAPVAARAKPAPAASPAPPPTLPPAASVPPIAEPAPPPVRAAGESLPEQLTRQMADSLAHGRDLDDLLHASLAMLEKSGAGADLGALKEQLRHGVEELLAEHRSLQHDLRDARRGLQAVSEDRKQLAQALDRARRHSLTDELTGLPNRTAFLRSLNAEIGRARRYGFSLALALIDVDDLKGVNTRYGQAAGDAVLHAYANEIMAQFRGYDLVARYGGDEFAVLLPNTQKEGASRAVEKAQKRAAGTYIQFNGHNIPLPSFSSVLTLYAHGEPPATLLKRADEALSHAKQRGQAQAVVALPAG